MTRKLKRIAPVKFGIILGVFYGLISLIFVPFLLLVTVAASLAPSHDDEAQKHMAAGMSLVMCVVLPVFYTVFGGLFGMLAAWLYNVVAGWVGGIEFEVE